MRFDAVRQDRRGMLDQPHIAPLTGYVRGLRQQSFGEVPDFDPADGGTQAELLFLYEKPGPMTSLGPAVRLGSGFISRDNDDPTAEATFNFMQAINLDRRATVLWNVVPGWNGTRRIEPDELRLGVSKVAELIALLPRLRGIVLVGKKAQRAKPLLQSRLQVFTSDHPSPIVRATQPARWASIPKDWKEAADDLGLAS